MPTYPVTLQIEYIERRNRLTAFFRSLLALPHWIVIGLYGFGAYLVAIIAWFALLFTGRWPRGLYDFMAGYLRYYGRILAYANLAVDAYPPFTGEDVPGYPVRVWVAEPQPSYNRLKVFFRGLYMIPAEIIAFGLWIYLYLAVIVSWFVIVITGRQPRGLQDAIEFSVNYLVRVLALAHLVTETYPPLSRETAPAQPAAI